MEREDAYRIALAGLLHDIGKFAQRTGGWQGAHTEVGGEFVRQFVPEGWQADLYPVMGHHDEPLLTYEAKLIALADRLSAGERLAAEAAQPRQLLSIFCSLTADGQQAPEDKYWPLKPLRLEEAAVFPDESLAESQVTAAYSALWRGFEQETRHLLKAHARAESLSTYLESMLLLLQRYVWCVPSAYYRSVPDVSLYDHSRATAALAVCLMEQPETHIDELLRALKTWHQERAKALDAPPPPVLEETTVALLVGGDISGVQDFIYTITARGATSALRGRSFYLQLLTEAVARYVLRRLELPITNLLYQGGGHFYLLARPSDSSCLAEIRQEVSRILLRYHQGDLYLALAELSLVAADFYEGRISQKWGALVEHLRRAKQRRFAELGPGLADLFAPQGHGGNEERECQVCGREHPGTRTDDDVRKCPPCLSYEELGDRLRQARYLWLTEMKADDELGAESGGWEEVLRAFGLQAGVAEELTAVPNTGRPRWILALEDDAMDNLRPDAHTVVGRRLLVNVTPVYGKADEEWLGRLPKAQQGALRQELPQEPQGKIKPFALLEAQSTGIPRLGVLRMDVDNLGTLFAKGLGDQATFSRVAALSFAISLFFEGWVEVLAKRVGKTADGRDRLYSIYSGGDDLFFVGSWDAVVELARKIRADLTRFAADHPGVHASAGIALVGGKYPLYQAAGDAGRAEAQAKEVRRRVNGREHRKDGIAFLGQAIPWRQFGVEECREGMETVHSLAHWLERLTRDEQDGGAKAPKALLQMLIRLQEQYAEATKERALLGEDRNKAGEEQVYYGPWMWRGHYFLKRMARRYEKDDPEVAKAVDGLAEHLHGENFRAIEWIGLAARWAELLGRDRST
ncbi:MAG: type III-A CRISPR-associated protein Cas10/Csm1 [Anaerolineae bacterium]|nr:type III-A CRISPR-associated protein Cas10/Csm1 [Anaerolineae bacterium]MDW8098087.1 type III-A CRISPR-associated protein Cas10/Csm1 [Anaerolineae bacterium]